MPITTTPSERIGLCTRMRRFLDRFIRPESFVHTRSSAGFTITTSEFKFSVHTAVEEYSDHRWSSSHLVAEGFDLVVGTSGPAHLRPLRSHLSRLSNRGISRRYRGLQCR